MSEEVGKVFVMLVMNRTWLDVIIRFWSILVGCKWTLGLQLNANGLVLYVLYVFVWTYG